MNQLLQEHDPGGKVASPLPEGMFGGAAFSGPRNEYRHLLDRCWDDDLIVGLKLPPFALWIGANPSRASALFNDPTVTREIRFTKAFGFRRYVKTNIADYRSTKPSGLRLPGVVPRSSRNLSVILEQARSASKVIVCWGAVHPILQPYADETADALTGAGVEMFCLGVTKSGQPRHPLYRRGDTPLIPYRRAA